jgi:hypothetical protein
MAFLHISDEMDELLSCKKKRAVRAELLQIQGVVRVSSVRHLHDDNSSVGYNHFCVLWPIFSAT